ncbi:554_t:CDS:2 [Ambispora gerdemannii]|uniref:554_t:CDS:1 n=1 Tax=Ambispora gerdemannii TaxID=144530 RepID=A0A9N9AR15_9GLOM|nr:554_t:CDS:2 [Ambispora gerdemannii]
MKLTKTTESTFVVNIFNTLHQLGGHEKLLSMSDGSKIVKPSTTIEREFYENIVLHPEFAPWIPRFFGIHVPNADLPDQVKLPSNDDSIDLCEAIKQMSEVILYGTLVLVKEPSGAEIKLTDRVWKGHNDGFQSIFPSSYIPKSVPRSHNDEHTATTITPEPERR